MIGLTFSIENIDTVMQVYNQIQVIRYIDTPEFPPDTPVGQPITLTDWVLVSGTEDYPVPVNLVEGKTYYITYDPEGEEGSWYSSRYYDDATGSYSGWSYPVLGGEGDLYYDPIYPDEVELTVEEKSIVKRIRLYIGDPLGIKRDHGQHAFDSIHPDGRTYELDEKGWPVYITMGGVSFNQSFNPSVNGYRYLKFQRLIDDVCRECVEVTDLCGDSVEKELEFGVDIWYYTFRNSDRQILEAYDNCPPPPGLTLDTATSQAYILQTSIDLLRKELAEDSTEDGAVIRDEGTSYDPYPGLRTKKDILDDLKKQLDALIKANTLKGISGVLID